MFNRPIVSSVRNAETVEAFALIIIVSLLFLLDGCSGVSAPPNSGGTSATNSAPNLAISAVLPNAVVGMVYDATVEVAEGTPPYEFTLAAGQLPTGLLLGATTGVIAGKPTMTGAFNFDIRVTDSKNLTKHQSFQVVVSTTAAVSVAVTPAETTVSSGGSTQFSVQVRNTSNTSVTWSATLGTISSTGLYTAPQVSTDGSTSLTVTSVADSTKSASAYVTITATSVTPIDISTTPPPEEIAGKAYSFSFTASGGKTPYTWSLSSGALPAGLTLLSAGSLTGTAIQAGQSNFTLQAEDSASPPQSATQSFILTVTSSSGSSISSPAATFFGFTENDTQGGNFPTVSYGMQRFWDSPPLQWPFLNPASGVFDFSNLDSALAQAYSSGVMEGMFTLARTPTWATSRPTDTNCHYIGGRLGGGNGECDPPSDINNDGSGPNVIWKAWITAIATHVNSAGYTSDHAHIRYWEVWNEADTHSFWAGSIAQLARLTEDANCIITGRGIIHDSGNGTATPCTATAIDPTAQIIMASAHAKTANLTYGQNELYCNNTEGIPAYELPCPSPPNAIASAVDIINFHMKQGNESGNSCPAPTLCTPESAMQMYVSNIESILQPAELTKPLWNGEASYSESGFTGLTYTDADMAASFMPRFYLVNWSLGVTGLVWYSWDELTTQTSDPTQVQAAYQQTYQWLVNSTLDTPCAAKGTVWSCSFTKAGAPYLVMWDTAQTCSAGICTVGNQAVASLWTEYQDMTFSDSVLLIVEHTVPVGIKPIVLN